VKFPRNERIRSTDVIAERVEYFLDPNFWGDYNVIEPDQQINDAIKRLSEQITQKKIKEKTVCNVKIKGYLCNPKVFLNTLFYRQVCI